MAEEKETAPISGLLGKKVGMTQVFDPAGNVVPVTVLEVGPCTVTQVKTQAKDGYNAVQVGYGKSKKINKPQKGHLKETNARYLREFKVKDPAPFEVGQQIRVDLFAAGDKIIVSGVSIGKGFQGTIKRHHHHRSAMSHGSKSHRIPGSIGSGTTPGRVYKGRAMAGRMGNEKVTVKNIKVVEVNKEKNLLLLHGAVPGKKGNLIAILKG
ncbi:MAG: 50S ribosomal protein L3 [Candidatus Margulisbacteria bacterium]|nr:50S ribosomal protein L3 [Candidatus Margulisiibacteriota bacterium]